MVTLVVQVVVAQYLEEVTHHRCPKRRERLTTYRDGLVGFSGTIIENDP
jgi:hypothetical protein